jgi:hypothetical protein
MENVYPLIVYWHLPSRFVLGHAAVVDHVPTGAPGMEAVVQSVCEPESSGAVKPEMYVSHSPFLAMLLHVAWKVPVEGGGVPPGVVPPGGVPPGGVVVPGEDLSSPPQPARTTPSDAAISIPLMKGPPLRT